MENPCSWQQEALPFAEELFADLMSRHPLFHLLPRKPVKCFHFMEPMGKCVMHLWREIRNKLEKKLRYDFPRFAKTEDSFKEYLKYFADAMWERKDNIINYVLIVSAILIGILLFVHRRNMTHFIGCAPHYLLFMLRDVSSSEFHKEGGWITLSSVAKTQIEDYDDSAIFKAYVLSCSYASEIPVKSSKISSMLSIEDTAKSSRKETVKESSPNKTRVIVRESVTEQDSISHKVIKEEICPPQDIKDSEDYLRENRTLCILSPVLDRSEVVVEGSEDHDRGYVEESPKFPELSQTEVSQVVLESTKYFEKESGDLASKKLITSKLVQSVKDLTTELNAEKLSDHADSTVNDISKTFVELTDDRRKDYAEEKDPDLRESPQSETSQSTKEGGELEVESSFQSSLRVEKCRIVDEFVKYPGKKSPEENSDHFGSTSTEINRNAYDSRKDLEDSIEPKYSDLPEPLKAETIQIALESVKDQEKVSTDENNSDLPEPLQRETIQTASESIKDSENASTKMNGDHLETLATEKNQVIVEDTADTEDSTKKKDPRLHKTPRFEKNQKNIPEKKYSVRDAVTPKILTPTRNAPSNIKDKTPTTPKRLSVGASKEKSKTETRQITPKALKSDSFKSKSPITFSLPKSSADRGQSSKIQPKSSEKVEKSRRLSLTKTLPEISKSLPRTTSATVVRATFVSKNLPPASEKSREKPLQSSNTGLENITKMATASGKSLCLSASKTDVSNNKPEESSTKDDLDTTLPNIEVTSRHRRARRHGEKKIEKLDLSSSSAKQEISTNTTSRTRVAPAKSTTKDPKNEKPRWR